MCDIKQNTTNGVSSGTFKIVKSFTYASSHIGQLFTPNARPTSCIFVCVNKMIPKIFSLVYRRVKTILTDFLRRPGIAEDSGQRFTLAMPCLCF